MLGMLVIFGLLGLMFDCLCIKAKYERRGKW